MKTFNDNAGRIWTIQISVDAISRVRALMGVDLLEVIEGKLIDRLNTDPILLCNVIYAICKADADAKSISDTDFGRAMAGDAIEAATIALLDELVSFFPPARRKLLIKTLKKYRALEIAAMNAVDARLDSAELENQLQAELARLGISSGDAQGSSVSTLVPSA